MATRAPFVFRSAAEDDLDRLIAIHTSAFPNPRGHDVRVQNFRANRLGALSDLHVAERDGEIVAHAFLFPLEVWFGGRRVKVGGVASVGVAPEVRGEGAGAALLGHLHAASLSRGDAVSLLYAFRQGFYAKHGYAPTSPSRTLRVHPASIPSEWRTLAPGESLRAASGPDREGIEGAYDRAAASSTGFLVRPPALWDSFFANERRVLTVLRRGADVAGYVAWSLLQTESHATVHLVVHDLVALDDAARRALYGCIGAQRDQVTEVEIVVDADDPMDRALVDADRARPGTEALEHSIGDVANGPMIKILDVDRAIAARGYLADGAIDLVVDGRSPRRVEVNAGRASIAASRGGPSLALDARTLAAVLYGALSVRDAARLGWVHGDDATIAHATTIFELPPYLAPDDF